MSAAASNLSASNLSASNLPESDLSAILTTPFPEEFGVEVSSYKKIDGYHYMFDFAANFAVGSGEFCGFEPGFLLHRSDAVFSKPFHQRVSAPDVLRIRISSDGTGRYEPVDGSELNLDGPCAAFIIEPPGMAPAHAWFESHHRAVHLYVDREHLQTLYAGNEAELPQALRDFLAGTLRQTVVRRVALNSSLLQCLEEIQDCAHEGRTRRLFFQSKALEILCAGIDALNEEESFGTAEASGSTLRGVLLARKILAERFANPPSLDDLAQEVGLSRSGLCAGFRKVWGKTIHDQVQQLRMERALTLLAQPGTSVSAVAYEVGYVYVSSFSNAVQKHFGFTPTELRRRALLDPAAN